MFSVALFVVCSFAIFFSVFVNALLSLHKDVKLEEKAIFSPRCVDFIVNMQLLNLMYCYQIKVLVLT